MATPAELLEQSLTALRNAKRFSAASQSYRKDNPAEYAKVIAYLDGGVRPSGVTTEMGKHAVLEEDARRALVPVPPPPPPSQSLPAVITSGGTYSGTSTGTVQVRTTAPVIIENSAISGTAQPLLDVNYSGAQVTVRRVTFTGAKGADNQAIFGANVKSLLIENCTLVYTWGIRVDSVQAGGSLIVRYCKASNIQRYKTNPSGFSHFFQTAFNGSNAFTCECAWNEVVNVWGEGQGSDLISIHSTHGAQPKVHDNYLEGSFVDQSDTNPALGHSGSGVMIEEADNCDVYGNIVVACTNCGIGMADGANNVIHDNRCISSGKTPSGTQFGGANVGIYCNAGQGGNQVRNNYIGWMRVGGRNDAYLPLDGGAWYAQNQYVSPGSLAITRAMEESEYQGWLTKVAAAGVTIGA